MYISCIENSTPIKQSNLHSYVSPIHDMGTAIREFKKRHSGSIERVSEYRSIGYASIGYGYGWVSEVSVNSDSPVAICVCFPKISASAVCVYLIAA